VNEASFLELLNCVALLTYLEKAMKDLCCFSITTNMRFRRYGQAAKLLFRGAYVHNWVKWLECESDHKPLSNVEIMGRAVILSLYMSVRRI
jgi:hypothetical protein